MSERTDDLTRDSEAKESVDVGDLAADDTATEFSTDITDFGSDRTTDTERTATTETDAGVSGRMRGRVDDAFSLSSFALNAIGALVGTFVIGGAVPLGPLSGIVGVFLALFAISLVSRDSRYVEAGLSGVLSGVLTTLLTTITLSVISGGLLPVAGGVVGGFVAVLAHYAGRDLRDGLTRDL